MALKKKSECKRGAPAYMLTYGDMTTLLLTFFVMLLTMAKFEPTRFAMTVQSLQGAFGVLESFPTIAVMPIVRIPKFGDADQRRKQSLEDAQNLQEKLKEQSMDDAVKVNVTESGIAVMLIDPATFSTGSDKLGAKSINAIKEVSNVLKKYPDAQVRVEGHTDDVPIRSSRFPSNWELSAARALAVVKVMAKFSNMDPGRLSAVGYGEYRPLVPNTSTQNRQRNRRIEIYIDYTSKE